MNFSELFYQNVKANRMINIDATPSFLIPNVYQPAQDFKMYSGLLTLLGGGSVQTRFPVSFSFQPMDCFLILYTSQGGGKLFSGSRTCSVTEATLTFIDCSEAFSLQSLVVPWNFHIYFLKGPDMNLYKEILSPSSLPVFHIPDCSETAQQLKNLLSIHTEMELSDILCAHRLLTDIFCTLSESRTAVRQTREVPSYLLHMWDTFEHHYRDSFSLADLESLYNISRYRLCREFTAAYGISPLQFLIRKRLTEAKKLLHTTDWTIQEISGHVGYDNVNHFIHLFKKDTGYTPNAYRKLSLTEKPACYDI